MDHGFHRSFHYIQCEVSELTDCAYGQVSLYTFVAPLGSSMMAPALPDIALHYNITSQTEIAATLSVFLLTFAIGPLFLAPISEMYGRSWVRRQPRRVQRPRIHACNF